MTDRKSHWQKIYQDTSALDVSWYQQMPALSLKLIRNTQIGSDAPIIDVGGGASVLVDCLHKEGFSKLAVLDISTNALASAKQRLGDAAKFMEWFEADITAFTAPHPFSLWHDRAVFHFLTDPADRQRYVTAMKNALPPGGHVIIAAFAIGGPKKCSGLEIVQYDTKKLCAELGPNFVLQEQMEEIHITPAGGEQKFAYFRFLKTI